MLSWFVSFHHLVRVASMTRAMDVLVVLEREVVYFSLDGLELDAITYRILLPVMEN
jgi:hypothetical protein